MDGQVSENSLPNLEGRAKLTVAGTRRKQHSNRFKRLRYGLKILTQFTNPEREKDYELKQHRWQIHSQLVLKNTCPRFIYLRAKAITGAMKHAS